MYNIFFWDCLGKLYLFLKLGPVGKVFGVWYNKKRGNVWTAKKQGLRNF